ncbi:DUF349 domain-containing protein [Glaciibacter flavus]|uniref:DUF349 domain-containing protein n=1 Tax=Orlajensenia flava TaxID=2565934 RepID=A0A4S4FWX9_9MICO|nr:DUF349 domain-containing protein [Glaciibacter flavus]THG35323.1 DUF349 domain-containing protein [Glaciibacter flavus]
MASDTQHPWGRVDETGTVFVIEADGEREVGQFPDATPDEALAYYERKFTDLAGQVTLLEQRAKRGAPAADIAKTVSTLSTTVATANAVGDLAALARRLEALGGTVTQLTEQQSAEDRAATDAAIAERTAIVEAAEKLAAADPAKTQWKQTTTELDALFACWQSHQHEGARVPKGVANELWKRFRAARTTIETHRKAFFSDLDNAHRDVRSRKQELIDRAEALAPKGADGIPTYRGLLDDWKAAGRAGKKQDDALWARFKAAGDVLYGAKAEVDAAENEEFSANLTAKLALLDEAQPILSETDRTKARAALTGIQRRWDEIGKVPRDQVKPVEERMRKVENAVRKLDDDHWVKNNPETKARADGLAGQLNSAIAKLEDELAAAKASKDKAAIAAATEALETRKAWLGAINR